MSDPINNEKKIITRDELAAKAAPVLQTLGYGAHTCEDAEKQMKTVVSDLAVRFGKLDELELPVFGGWCAYAGIGCVRLLRDNEKAFEKKGVVETLSETRGFEGMDEYVTNIIGLGFGTAASDKLIDAIFTLAETVLSPLADLEESDGELLFPQMQECFEAMYLVGVSILG